MNFLGKKLSIMQILLGMLAIVFVTFLSFFAYETNKSPEIEFALACSSTSNPDQLYFGYDRSSWAQASDWTEYQVWRSGLEEDGLKGPRHLWVCENALVNHGCAILAPPLSTVHLDRATLVRTERINEFSGDRDSPLRLVQSQAYQCEDISLEMFEHQRHLASLPVQLR